MHRVLERLDALGGTLVPLSYLAGLLLGTMSYFAGLTSGSTILAVAIGMAVGSEVHSFLQQRRARAAFAEYQRLHEAHDLGEKPAQDNLRLQVAILTLLVLFQCFTATAFVATNWHPAGGGVGAAIQVGIRGCVVPLLFLLSGLLTPLTESPGAILSKASQDILHFAVGRNVQHWRKRIRMVHRKGGDLSPLMVALLTEEGEDRAARRTSLIAANLELAEQQIGQRRSWWQRLTGQVQQQPLAGALLGRPDVTQLSRTRHSTQPGNEAPAILRGSVPTARPAFYSHAPAPVLTDEEGVDVGDDLDVGGVIELVSDERGQRGNGNGNGRDEAGMTRHTRKRGPDRTKRKQRRDAGKLSEAQEQRVQRLIPELLRREHAGEKMTLDDVEVFLECSRGTASHARQEAVRRIMEGKLI